MKIPFIFKKCLFKAIKFVFKETFYIEEHHKITLVDINTGEKKVFEFDNISVTSGRTMIVKRLVGEGNACDITYAATGTDNTTPDVLDNTLGTELYRKTVTVRSYSGNIASFSTFFGIAVSNGAIEEIGYFGEAASGTPDSGTMVIHALISLTKTSSQTMTLDSTVTIN